MSEQLAAEKSIKHGDVIRVWSKRGSVKGKALVTKRLKPLTIDGKTVHYVGLPLNFGFIGEARKANPINGLTPPVGDANSQTPEFKAFLVNVERVATPVA
jgi:formate dehydrogenase major subunit